MDIAVGARANELRLLAANDQPAKSITLSAEEGHASVYPEFALSTNGQAALAWFDIPDCNREIDPNALLLADRLARDHERSPGAD